VLLHLVSGSTLCPLGQPKKVIGLESPIGPWLPIQQPATLVKFQENGRASSSTITKHETVAYANSLVHEAQGETSLRERCVGGLDVNQSIRARTVGEKMSLDIPSYRTSEAPMNWTLGDENGVCRE